MYRVKASFELFSLSLRKSSALFGTTVIGYLLLQFRGLEFLELIAGKTVFNVQSAPFAFPFFGYWMLIWPSIVLFPLMYLFKEGVSEQFVLAGCSRIKYWAFRFCVFGISTAVLDLIFFSFFKIFLIYIALTAVVIFTGGSILITSIWLLLALSQKIEISFFCAILFPVIGMNSFIKLLPANFLMPVRAQEAGLMWWQVLLIETVYLVVIFVIGCIFSYGIEYKKGEIDER